MPEAIADPPNDLPEDNYWQFMITGGVDFGMPLTVFQVTEGGKADRVGLKLGDSVVQINGQDTSEMSLQDAQKLIEISDSQLKLKVQNVDDEEVTGHAEVRDIVLQTEKKAKKSLKEDIDSLQPSKPDSLEEQLKAMQQRLSELTLIPGQIQETLMNVAKTMQKFLPPGSLIVTDHPQEIEIEPIDQYDDSYRFDNEIKDGEDHHATDDDLDDTEMDFEAENGEVEGAIGGGEDDAKEDSPVQETEETLPEEPEEDKANQFEKKWPWGLNDRNPFKKSTFQGHRSNSLIQNRIKQLNEKQLFASYRRNQSNIGN